MKKVELLAPAGDYRAFLGAIHAGADAVYLGGPRFGARAYAQNFTEEEVCRAIRYAHLFKRKVYLTLNTLMKETEMEQLYDYLCPYYEAGLDGVIVQDMGVVRYVRKQFPDMELHISTQATIMGRHGAALMKEAGAVRIVPARELSLQEIRQMKEDTGLEIETFIHGAVCYCYSGQCLFSSTLGGRSGNRGRCAQPCRLPYSAKQTAGYAKGTRKGEKGQELYPLSLKDMCTIEHIPELIRAGIDSFKIEGRMKKAEYAAGVTAIYRKYIDRYYAAQDYRIEKEDLDTLKSLYIRSGLQDGYYKKHNGKEMVTLTQPGYAGCNEKLLCQIRERYLDRAVRIPVQMKAYLFIGKAVCLTVSAGQTKISVQGMEVQEAKSRPMTEEEIGKQLKKTGDTAFFCENLQIEMDEEVFLPVKALNELRREAFVRLETELTGSLERKRPDRLVQTSLEKRQSIDRKEPGNKDLPKDGLHIEVHTVEQALTVLHQPGVGRLYLPAECFEDTGRELGGGLGSILAQVEVYKQENPEFTFYMALPHIFRKRSEAFMEKAYRNLLLWQVDGVLVRNLEEIAWLREKGYKKPVQADPNLYVWNREAERFFEELSVQTTLPLELSKAEMKQLDTTGKELVVYGRTPLMITANCVRKTMTQCLIAGENAQDREAFFHLTDRYRKEFPVWTNCTHCYNIIYNSVPTSLHSFLERGGKWDEILRLNFTTESRKETEEILHFFADGCRKSDRLPFAEYTSGYYKRGVE
ncbi:MAG: U32 family peptidase [Clostridiales bacterium]|nr:U32 family peptidase [Clostridiales bacterium]